MLAIRIPQITQRHAPRLMYCRISAWKQHIAQVCPSRKTRKIRNQEFASPNPAIETKPGSVKGNAYDGTAQTVLRHTTGDMCMMMLHPDFTFDLAPQCHLSAPVARVQIIRNHPWCNPKEMLHSVERLLEKLHSLVVLKVSDVLAQNCVMTFSQTKGTLQFCTEGQRLSHLHSNIDRLGYKPSRTTQHPFAALKDAND